MTNVKKTRRGLEGENKSRNTRRKGEQVLSQKEGRKQKVKIRKSNTEHNGTKGQEANKRLATLLRQQQPSQNN
jgi:hypothetical protein